MKEVIKKVSVTVLKTLAVLSVAIVIYGAGIYVGENSIPSVEKISGISNKEGAKPDDVDFSLFWDVWRDLEGKYVDKGKVDKQAMIYGAISGMVKSVGDPYTVFLDPEEAKRFKDDVMGSFEGIGAEIGLRKNIITVISPLNGTPAEKAGLRAGDKILKIDDEITVDMTVEEAVSLIRGKRGEEVVLTIARNGFDDAKEIKIIRDVINAPVVKFEMKDKGIAYIEFSHFTSNSSMELRKAIKDALDAGSKKMILDLRNNPGGYLDVAVDIASIFIPSGEVVVSEKFGDGSEEKLESHGPGVLKDFPMVILVNEGSASASEILAGALRDISGVKLIGEKTFGKGSVQELNEDLRKSGASLKVTIAKWYTPKGYSISDGGLKPDVEVDLTNEDYENDRDPQLDKALEIIKSM